MDNIIQSLLNKTIKEKQVKVEITYEDALEFISKCKNITQLERFNEISSGKMGRSAKINFFTHYNSLDNEFKLELLSEAYKKYSLSELEQRLK